MKKSTTLAVVLAWLVASVSVASAQQTYGWSISSSDSDPFVNFSAAPSGAPLVLYLWFVCGDPDGMAATEFGFEIPDGVSNFGFTTLNGFLNAGSSSNLQLIVGGCPQGPVVAGSWTVFDNAAGNYCLVNSTKGIRVTVNCAVDPVAFDLNAKGFGVGSAASCDEVLQCVVPVEPTSWGAVKSLYR